MYESVNKMFALTDNNFVVHVIVRRTSILARVEIYWRFLDMWQKGLAGWVAERVGFMRVLRETQHDIMKLHLHTARGVQRRRTSCSVLIELSSKWNDASFFRFIIPRHAASVRDTTTLCLKKVPTFKLSVTLSNLNQFSNFLYCWKAYESCYNNYTTPPISL